MNSISPVFTEKEVEIEKVIALDQPTYAPLIILPVLFDDNTLAMAARFEFTKEERKKIASGANLIIIQLTFGEPYTPIELIICEPGKNPYEEGV